MRALQLQRASAGSGKTFTLARKFIWNLITAPVSHDSHDGSRRLCRGAAELSANLNSILAVTFTNKATAEMKQRIVEKLAALSMAAEAGPEVKIDYLGEFVRELGVSREEIASTCGKALAVVLNRFSDFNVSTIDAFFQSVLRTFAYETNLPDSYEVEIDSDMLAVEGIDSALRQINSEKEGSRPAGGDARFWVSSLMEYRRRRESASGWNIYNRAGTRGLYSDTVRNARMLENEKYKMLKPELDEYFRGLKERGMSFADAFAALEEANEHEAWKLFKEAREHARRAVNLIKGLPDDQRVQISSQAMGPLEKIASMTDIFTKAISSDTYKKMSAPDSKGAFKKTTAKKWLDAAAVEVNVAAVDAVSAYMQLDAVRDDVAFRHWRVYKPSLLFLGMLLEVRNALMEYMAENNLVELSEAGMIIRRIIGGSDIPFIYERLGTRISHYLIDEFQDTSLIQWENMVPLLREGISTGEESLVIGDPKQSIYRFRNADSSIITKLLPETFPSDCRICGDSVEENTNWRSERTIVEFNNYFFHTLSRMASDMTGKCADLSASYGGVVQQPSRTERGGLVDVRFFTSVGKSGEIPGWYRCIGPMIAEMVERGYRRRDIAVLVDTNRQGADVIASLMEYNALPDTISKIEFISEESLLVSQSKGVGIVIAALRALGSPTVMTAMATQKRKIERGTSEDETRVAEHTGVGDGNRVREEAVWDDLRVCFALYMARHEDEPGTIPELLERFRNDPESTRGLLDLVDNLEVMTLPAIVEHVIHTFVSERLRRVETPFLAALQDMVIDYCSRYTGDIDSFLRWWDTTGCRRSVASPEGVDAVNVMTIHKSKGLQFKCVIIPDAGIKFAARGAEWRWVEPAAIAGDPAMIPPKVPVSTEDMKEVTAGSGKYRTVQWEAVHADDYREYVDSVTLDQLNKAYVGFTRAEEELHLFVPVTPKSSQKVAERLNDYIRTVESEDDDVVNKSDDGEKGETTGFGSVGEALLDLCLDHGRYLSSITADKRMFMFSADVVKSVEVIEDDVEAAEGEGDGIEKNETDVGDVPEPLGVIAFGEPFTAGQLEERRQRREEKERRDLRVTSTPEGVGIEGYRSFDFPAALRFRDPRSPLVAGDVQDLDPRSEGILLHSLLEHIETVDDVDAALRRMRVGGKITGREMESLREKTLAALAQPGVTEWFRPGLKVLNERTILRPGEEDRRPDRVVVDEEGRAVVIDFKFGRKERKGYEEQVGRYVDLLRETGRYVSVEGYVWYVGLEKRVRVGR